MYLSNPCFHLDESDNGEIGKMRTTVFNDIALRLGGNLTVFMSYAQAIELLDNLTEGLSKMPERVKRGMTEEETLKVLGWA